METEGKKVGEGSPALLESGELELLEKMLDRFIVTHLSKDQDGLVTVSACDRQKFFADNLEAHNFYSFGHSLQEALSEEGCPPLPLPGGLGPMEKVLGRFIVTHLSKDQNGLVTISLCDRPYFLAEGLEVHSGHYGGRSLEVALANVMEGEFGIK